MDTFTSPITKMYQDKIDMATVTSDSPEQIFSARDEAFNEWRDSYLFPVYAPDMTERQQLGHLSFATFTTNSNALAAIEANFSNLVELNSYLNR